MKSIMKNQNCFFIILVLIVILLLQSCVTTDKVTNSKIIQKRKYNKGFYFDLLDKYKLSNNHIKINNSIEYSLAGNEIDSIKKLGGKNDIKDSIFYKSILIASVNGLPLPLQNEKSKTIDSLRTTKGSKHKRLATKAKFYIKKSAGFESNNSEKSWKATIGFGLSISGMVTILLSALLSSIALFYLSAIFIIPAIILCIMGIKQTRKEKATGRTYAIVGLIIGGISLIFLLWFSILYLIALIFGYPNYFPGMI